VNTIDVLVDSFRWINSAVYRTRMLERASSAAHAWRFVCRNPEGGIQVVAGVSFFEGGKTRTVRARLRDVKR
jgi:hypothetical protein